MTQTGPAAAILRRGTEEEIRHRHPWVRRTSVARLRGEVPDGGEVVVEDEDGAILARGLYNARGPVSIRCYAWNRFQRVDDALLTVRIGAAVAVRERLGLTGPGRACRLVFSEADGLSGLVVDRYDRWLVARFHSLALWQRRDAVAAALGTHAPSRGILVRSGCGILVDPELDIEDHLLRGEAPDGPVTIEENGVRYAVDLGTGDGAGHRMDQRDNRIRAAEYATGRRVVDACCYTGGFTLPLLRAGASSVTAVDRSAVALDALGRNLALNGLDDDRTRRVEADAASWLEEAHAGGERFEMAVLDPPRLPPRELDLHRALDGYGRLNEAAVRSLEPGGILVTSSCTSRVSRADFVAMLGRVEERTTRRIRILEQHGQPADHPVAPTCPETAYLKCVIALVE